MNTKHLTRDLTDDHRINSALAVVLDCVAHVCIQTGAKDLGGVVWRCAAAVLTVAAVAAWLAV